MYSALPEWAPFNLIPHQNKVGFQQDLGMRTDLICRCKIITDLMNLSMVPRHQGPASSGSPTSKCKIARDEPFFFVLVFPLQALEFLFGKRTQSVPIHLNSFLDPDSVTSYTSALRIYAQLSGVTMGGRQVTTAPTSCVTCQGRCRTRKKSKNVF